VWGVRNAHTEPADGHVVGEDTIIRAAPLRRLPGSHARSIHQVIYLGS
jgi:hypothetical protein